MKDTIALIKKGAPVSEWDGPETPLRMAVMAKNIELVSVIIKAGASPNEVDKKGVSVLHFAVFDDNQECVNFLLNKRGNVNVTDRHGQTPLFFAPNPDMCDILTK